MNTFGGGGQEGNSSGHPTGHPPGGNQHYRPANENDYYTPPWLHEFQNTGVTVVQETNLLTSAQVYHTVPSSNPGIQEFVSAARDYGQLPPGYEWSHPPSKKARN